MNAYMEQQHRDKKEIQQRLVAIVGPVVKLLGAPWKMVPPIDREEYGPETEIVVTGDGEESFDMFFGDKYNGGANRIVIRGNYPRYRDGSFIQLPHGESDNSKITVAAERGATVLAKEITRRFLPEYKRVLALLQKRRDENASYEDKVIANTKQMAAALHEDVPDDKLKTGTFYLYKGSTHASGDIRVSSDNVDMNLRSVPFAIAERIAKILTETE